MKWWNSIPRMTQIHRTTTVIAIVCAVIGVVAFSMSPLVSVLAAVLGTTAVVCAAIAWFRLDHLREMERIGR